MHRRSVWRFALVVAGLLCAAIVLALWTKPFRIAYHKWRMDIASDQFFSGEPDVILDNNLVGYDVDEIMAVYEHHRDELVSLGYFFHMRYKFDHVSDAPGVHSTIWRRVMTAFPDNPHPTLSGRNVLDVWDRVDRRSEWDTFVAKHNVPDFSARYMNHVCD